MTRESGDLLFQRHDSIEREYSLERITVAGANIGDFRPTVIAYCSVILPMLLTPYNIELLSTLSVMTLFLLIHPAYAVDDDLGRIDVLAPTQLPFKTGDIVSSENTGFSSSIDYKDLKNAGFSLGEILDHEAATQVRSSGGFGSYSDISLRGAANEQVMIYLDSVLLNDGSGGGVDLSEIDTSQIVRIDIYRGSTPLQLSKASIGGAVNIITHRRSEETRTHLQTRIGSFNTRQINTRISGQHEKLGGLISLSTAYSDNDFEFVNDKQTHFNTDDDETQKRKNAQVSQHSALIKGDWSYTQHLKLDGSLRFLKKNQAIPGWNNQASTNASLDTDSWQARTRITSDTGFHPEINAYSELYYTEKHETYDDRNSQIGLGSQHDKNTTSIIGIKTYFEHIGERSTSAFSLDMHVDKYTRQNFLADQNDNQSQRDELDLGLQHSLFFDDEKWLLSPSIRSQWFKNEYHLEDKLIQSEKTSNYTTAQLGLRYAWSERIILKSNLGTYIREPNFFELFGDRGLLQGNNKLLPEDGTNLDMGIEWTNANHVKDRTQIRLQIGAWYSEVNDLIVRTYNAQGIGKSQNISAARLRGIEAGLNLNFNNGLKINTNITVQDPENRSNNAAFEGKILPGRAAQSLFTNIQYTKGEWQVSYEYDRQIKRFYDTANLLRAKNRSLHTLSIGKNFGKQFSTRIGINNVLDASYEDFNGFAKPGRAWTLSVIYNH